MTLTAVLFAGGASRRMGVDKATLVVEGEPLWARQLKILSELKPDALLVSARTKPAWCPPEIEVVLDEPPSRGPLSGLSAVLNTMRTTHLLALAVDLPRMEAGHLQKLWRLARTECGVIPRHGDEPEPLCAIYPGGEFARAQAERALSGDDFSLRSFAGVLLAGGRMKTFFTTEPERRLYRNVNTPDEFQRRADAS